MSFSIEDIFPNINTGLQNIGFIFGAGASKNAGYPLMNELTTAVKQKLTQEELDLIDQITNKELNSDPNIEEITDILEEYIVNSGQSDKAQQLIKVRDSVRKKITEIFLEIKNPDINDHVLFFNSLKKLFAGRDENIWIFTTNYDLLFEIAASYSKISLFNGFIGSGLQYFYSDTLHFKYGIPNGHNFISNKEPKIRLIKLHGSINWWKSNDNDNVLSSINDSSLLTSYERVMVLPRRKKVIETLDHPYDKLFTIASKIIGGECKYLVSCGYSFNDQHINETLLIPKLRQANISLVSFLKEENNNLKQLTNYFSFAYGTENSSKKLHSAVANEGTDLWIFQNFVHLLASTAGIK